MSDTHNLNAEQLYNASRRPSDPQWWKLPYYDHRATQEHGCFGKEHWEALAAGRKPRN